MATFEDNRGAQSHLILKALGGFIAVAPMSVPMPEKFTDASGDLIDLKAAGFSAVGWLTKGDGINFSRETDQQETESFGALEPTRVDFTKDVTSAAFRMQETNKQTLELYYNTDLDNIVVDESGEFSFVNDSQPSTIYRRAIYVGKDGNGDDTKYLIKAMPRAILAEIQEQGWNPEAELSYGLTMKATTDPELNYSVRHAFAGPGMKKIVDDMGFSSAGAEEVNTASTSAEVPDTAENTTTAVNPSPEQV